MGDILRRRGMMRAADGGVPDWTHPVLTFYKGCNPAPNGGVVTASSKDTKRACAFIQEQVNNGTEYVINRTNLPDFPNPAYPIPIPSGCTKVTVSCLNLRCAINTHKDNGTSVTVINSGYWPTVDGGVTDYNLASYIASGATHISIGFRNSSNSDITGYTIDNTTVQVVFS